MNQKMNITKEQHQQNSTRVTNITEQLEIFMKMKNLQLISIIPITILMPHCKTLKEKP